LTKLRSLGGTTWTDPRVEIAAARLANARDDPPSCIAHALRALELARAHDVPGLAAEAEGLIGGAKIGTDPLGAGAYLMQALADYRTVGNPRGQADIYLKLGNLTSGTDPAKARTFYTSSLGLSQSIGDKAGEASAEADIGIVLWQQGDRDGAEAAVRQVLELRRETEDVKGQAWALAALAVEQSDDDASDEAIDNFRTAIALDQTVGATDHVAFALYSLSDVLRLRGRLPEAANACAQAQAANATLAQGEMRGSVDFECGLIALDRGELDAARAGLARAAGWAGQHFDTMTVANSELTLGQLAMAQRDWQTAVNRLTRANQSFARMDDVPGQALAASFLALSFQASGRAAQAATEAGRAATLRKRVTERQEAVMTDIALAQYSGRAGRRGDALASLDAIAADAGRRHWLSWTLEARLAAIEFLPPAQARRARAALGNDARKLGFIRIFNRLS
ncbi:MAG TPA: tetratricopeptide repeat protein, partial [Sphingomonas sp.]